MCAKMVPSGYRLELFLFVGRFFMYALSVSTSDNSCFIELQNDWAPERDGVCQGIVWCSMYFLPVPFVGYCLNVFLIRDGYRSNWTAGKLPDSLEHTPILQTQLMWLPMLVICCWFWLEHDGRQEEILWYWRVMCSWWIVFWLHKILDLLRTQISNTTWCAIR